MWGRWYYIRNIFWKKLISCFSKTWVGQLNCWKTVIVRNSKSYHQLSVLTLFAHFFFWWSTLGYVGLSKPIFDGSFIHSVGDIKLIWRFLEICPKIAHFPLLLPSAIKVQNRSTNVTRGIISIENHLNLFLNGLILVLLLSRVRLLLFLVKKNFPIFIALSIAYFLPFKNRMNWF